MNLATQLTKSSRSYVDAFRRRFGFDPIREVQVLCPMNRGRIGARALNLDLQAALNGDQSKPSVVRSDALSGAATK
jgi:ATP-dependent exoDNAse (exonuclease V) alpha subunit